MRGLAYGNDERQCLDVYAPGRDGRRPVVLFVHGGAFVDGHRDRSPEIYANVLYYFARQRCVGVNMEYRLAPAHTYPSGTQDVAGAVAWVRQHIAQYGGDPEQIYLMGHSAGAAHAASYAHDRRHQPARGHGLAGLIVVSGRVRAENIAENPNARKVEAYYGNDAQRYGDVSPVMHAGAQSLPTMVAFAEYENPLIDLYCLELADRLAAAKRRGPAHCLCPRPQPYVDHRSLQYGRGLAGHGNHGLHSRLRAQQATPARARHPFNHLPGIWRSIVAKLQLSLGACDYDRTRAVLDGRAPVEGCDIIGVAVEPEEAFHRAFRFREFDITEMSLSSHTMMTSARTERVSLPSPPSSRACSAIPAFTSAPTAAFAAAPDLARQEDRPAGIPDHGQRMDTRHPAGRIRR